MTEPSGSTRSFEAAEEAPSADGEGVSPASGTVALMRTDRGLWVSATLVSRELCTCSRCLEDFSQSIDISIEEEALPVAELVEGDNTADADGSPSSFFIDPDQILDITEAVRQYTDLGIPMKPICKDGCLGICSTCGTNLNEAVCHCEEVTRDSRWGPLLDLVNAGEFKEGRKN